MLLEGCKQIPAIAKKRYELINGYDNKSKYMYMVYIFFYLKEINEYWVSSS